VELARLGWRCPPGVHCAGGSARSPGGLCESKDGRELLSASEDSLVTTAELDADAMFEMASATRTERAWTRAGSSR